MVHEAANFQKYLLGVLHGSRAVNCNPTTAKSPGLFANLEHPKNIAFIYKWKHLGNLFLSDNLEQFENQANITVNYLKNLDPHMITQNLWMHYNRNIEILINFKICQNSTDQIETFEAYGINCSSYNTNVLKICQNGRDINENYENFGVNCSCK